MIVITFLKKFPQPVFSWDKRIVKIVVFLSDFRTFSAKKNTKDGQNKSTDDVYLTLTHPKP